MFLETIRMWLRALFQRSRVESEMEKEMRLHLEMEIEANIRRGMSPDEARRRAAIAFGGVERHKEGVRDERFTRGIEELLAEFRFALRTLGKNRWFAALATLTLAIGIGATAGVYSLANWVLLRPIPGIAAPQELVVVSFEDSPGQPTGFSFATLDRVKESVDAFSEVMGTADVRLQLSGDNVIARSLAGALVGGDYFDVLKVRPARGRFFTRDELAATGAARVAVISWALWESQFGSDSAIVGRTVRFNANEFTIVGVAPREFRGIARLGRADAWFPAGIYGVLRHMAMDLTNPEWRVLRYMIARMPPGSSLPVAQQQMDGVAAALLRENPKGHSILESHPPHIYRDIGTPLFGRSRTAKTFRLLFAIGSIVLVIACANVANLLLLRGLARRPEFAVRKALGASASQLLRLHSAEGLIIGLVGGAIGVAVTLVVAQIFNGSPFVDGRYPGEQIQIDARVVGFVFLLALATGMLFGLIPGIATIRDRSNVALGDAGRRSTGGGGKLRAGLMVIQVSGSVALIAIALLLGRTIEALRRVELGFDPRNLTSLSINADPQGYSPERLRSLRNELLSAIQAQPGVDTVSVSTSGLPQRASHNADIRPATMVTDKWPFDARMSPVSPGYFATLGIPILAGRDFTSVDEASSTGAPAIINETTARNLFGERSPVGEALVKREYSGTALYRIVGVVRDARAADVREPQGPVVYVPMVAAPAWQSEMEFLVRSARPMGDVDGMLRRVVTSIDPSIPIGPVVSATSIIEDGVRGERVFLNLVALLGSLAIVLAAIGLYGVTAYSVAQRRREIGIRIALGAGVRAVINTVTRQAAVIAVMGVTMGLVVAATLAGALERMLFGVPRLDFVSYAGAAFVFALFATLACIIPARSAALVDPTEALRAE